jgi:fibronectin type 3 domain-containing protein
VYLAWSGSGGSIVGHHVYREDGQGRTRLTASPQSATSYLDAGLDVSKSVTYRVTAVDAQGCESAYSAETTIAPRR